MNTISSGPRANPLRRTLRHWIRVTATSVVLSAFSTAIALAEKEASAPKEEKPWLQWLLLVAFAVLCTSIAFKNPKRSHLG